MLRSLSVSQVSKSCFNLVSERKKVGTAVLRDGVFTGSVGEFKASSRSLQGLVDLLMAKANGFESVEALHSHNRTVQAKNAARRQDIQERAMKAFTSPTPVQAIDQLLDDIFLGK